MFIIDRTFGVIRLKVQKKCILVAEKSCYLQEQSSWTRCLFFSLIKFFFFSIWTVKTEQSSVLTTIKISKKNNLIAEKKSFLSEKTLRLFALFFQSNVFPATTNSYSFHFYHDVTSIDWLFFICTKKKERYRKLGSLNTKQKPL